MHKEACRIHVVGYKGIVGSATYELFRRLGYSVTGSDKGEVVARADIYFVCVPEDAVEEVVQGLANPSDLIVIRSSVIPGTCRRLMNLCEDWHICHNPEFLREAVAIQDEFSPDRIVIGQCCPEHGGLLKVLYEPLRRPIVLTDPTTSELVKLASNVHLSCLISYWNTIEEIAKRVGISGHEVGMIASLDPRISPYGSRLHHKFSGRCLPKDTRQLISLSQSLGYDPVLLRAVEEVNNSL